MVEQTVRSLLARADALVDSAAGDPTGSLAAAEQLLAEARAAGDDAALVAALRALAQCHRLLYAHDDAEPLLDEAVRVARRLGLSERLGQALAARGALRHERGRTEAARRDLDRAADLLTGDAAAEVGLQRAALAHNAGRLTEAAGLYAALLRLPGLSADTRTRAANNLGLTQARLGRHAAAAAWLEKAAVSAAEVGPAYVAVVTESQAWTAVQAGRLAPGIALFDEAVGLWQACGLPLGELYAEYCDALSELRLLPEALEQAQRAAEMLDEQNVPLMAAEAQLRVARLALEVGDSDLAAEVAGQAADRLRSQRRSDWVARALVVGVQARVAAGTPASRDHAVALRAARVLEASGTPADAALAHLVAGQVALVTGRRAQAAVDFERSAVLSPPSPVLARVRGHLARAHAAQARDSDSEVLRACRAGLADLRRHRAALPSTELRVLASGHGAQLATLGLRALVGRGSASEVLCWMDRTRASALLPSDPGTVGELGEEMAALRDVQAQIAVARAETGREPPDLLGRQAELERIIRRRSWVRADDGSRPAAGPDTAPLTTASLRRALAGRVLVEYEVLDGTLLAAVVEPRRTRLVSLGPVADVEEEVLSLRMTLRTLVVCPDVVLPSVLSSARSSVRRLTGRLVAPLQLRDPGEVVVVPVGALQAVPWSALLPCPVSVAPSAALWTATTRSPRRDGPVLLAAGPHLAGAVDEIRSLAPRYPDARVLVPPDSGANAVRAALDGASLAHLACHGRVRTDNPTFSSLELADGPLTVQELDERERGPYRLVLAACDVGGGVAYPGNEALGFVGTLLARGTAGLVASAAPVDDRHVLPLMTALHEYLGAGTTLAQALHAARSDLDPDDPRGYAGWCSFTAYGAA